jgi:hypothetical protein
MGNVRGSEFETKTKHKINCTYEQQQVEILSAPPHNDGQIYDPLVYST